MQYLNVTNTSSGFGSQPQRGTKRSCCEPAVFGHTSLRHLVCLSVAKDMRNDVAYRQTFDFDPLRRVMQYSTTLDRHEHKLCYVVLDSDLEEGEVPPTDTLRKLCELDKGYHFFLPSLAGAAHNDVGLHQELIGRVAAGIAYAGGFHAGGPMRHLRVRPRDDATLHSLDDIVLHDLDDQKTEWERRREQQQEVDKRACDALWAKEEALFRARPMKTFPSFKPLF